MFVLTLDATIEKLFWQHVLDRNHVSLLIWIQPTCVLDEEH